MAPRRWRPRRSLWREGTERGDKLIFRRAVTSLLAAVAATGLLFAGAGVANAIGSTGCTSSNYVRQVTSYHGTICYTNTGYDNLTTSGFWTKEVSAGNNTGYVDFKTKAGVAGRWYFEPGVYPFYPADYPGLKSDVVSMVGLYIETNY
ncbi:hypothetical protein [Streptomyces sp. NPDC021020]|uniref:hypothetical protein n=1 Tax=Streptomyces sp. NPDC021020 TaxID=3365109 RepID=UPI0037A22296